MVSRLVELQLKAENIDKAKILLSDIAPQVKAMPGCSHLEILMDLHDRCHITTYSHWDSEADLDTYRQTDTFKNFWAEVKPMFAKPAKAWSSKII